MSNQIVAPVVAGLAVGIGFVLLLIFVIERGPSTEGALTTITGEVVCLPHKKGLFGDFETSECAIGFRAQDGRYYGFGDLFQDEKHNWLLSAQGSKELFNVGGVVRPAGDDFRLYDIAGVIEVNSAARADGTTSIYEAYHRHYNQLSGIVEEISKSTGGGYSMGIDEGCDDLGAITDVKASCILIVLEVDVPELSSKIPEELEGYPVHVVVQPLHSPILTTPALTEDQAIDIMKSDLRKRVGDVLVFVYPRDARDPEITENPLPLIYYRQEDNMAFRVNGTTHSIMGSCAPSVECFFNGEKDVLDSVAGKLFYFIDGSYSGEEKSSPAYYYIDAMNGDILWSYIGEDMPHIDDEFKNIEQIPEVKLFLEKYCSYDMTKGFGRSNDTIRFEYVAAAYVDKDGDGIKEANRRLDLRIFYDESGNKPIHRSYDPARLEQIEIHCREQTTLSVDIDKAFSDIIPPAYDSNVIDFIENTKCLF